MMSFRKRYSQSLLVAVILLAFSASGYAEESGGGEQAPQAPSLQAGAAGGSGSNTVLPDLFTGTMSYKIPIEVPPGRNGMDPGLALLYRSGNGNGWVGVGWELEVGAIERSTRNGVDYNGDNYLFRMAGATIELAYIGNDTLGNREYRSKIEGSFNRYKKMTAGYWEVTDKNGTVYYFGQTNDTRQYNTDTNNTGQVFKWCLDKVEDTNDNYMAFSYWKDQGQIYLDRIDYTGNGTLSPTNHVYFYPEDRTDAPVMYTTNFEVKTAKRLKTIEVKGNGYPVRAYKLVYEYGDSTGRSRLTTVQQYGDDYELDGSGTVIGGNALPAMTLGWQTDSNSWSTPYLNGPGPGTPVGGQCLTGDLNGDGMTDYWCETGSRSGSWHVALSTGSSWSTSYWSGPAPGSVGSQCIAGDLNGDGKTDFWCETGNGTGSWHVAVTNSTGTGWSLAYWSGPGPGTPVGGQCLTGI